MHHNRLVREYGGSHLTSSYSRGGHSWSGQKNVQYMEKQTTAFHRARDSYLRGGISQHRSRNHFHEIASTDHQTEVNYVSLETYIHIKDHTFCKQRVPRHKIACQSFYYPKEELENRDCGPTSAEESDECDSGVYDELVDSKQHPLIYTSADHSLETNSKDCKLEQISCEDDLSTNVYDVISASVCFDTTPSTSGTSEYLSLEDNCSRTANGCSRLNSIEVSFLPALINNKLRISPDSFFIVWLQELNIRVLHTFSRAPTHFIACVDSVSPEFLMDSDVKYACHSIGMMLKQFRIVDPSKHESRVIWILTFAHRSFSKTTSSVLSSSTCLQDLLVNFFEARREDSCVYIINAVA